MSFLEDLWQGTKRFFSKSCQKCKTNDADLPSGQRIITELVHQESHWHTHYHWHDGKLHQKRSQVWDKVWSHECQTCGHAWRSSSKDSFSS